MSAGNPSSEEDRPNGVVTLGILDARRIPVARNIAVDVFHEKIGREDAMHKVSPYVPIVKVILEQRRHLSTIPISLCTTRG